MQRIIGQLLILKNYGIYEVAHNKIETAESLLRQLVTTMNKHYCIAWLFRCATFVSD